MTWTEPGAPLWVLLTLLLLGTNGLGLLASLALERWGLPAGWSIQATPRRPGTLRRHLPLILANVAALILLGALGTALLEPVFVFERPSFLGATAVLATLIFLDDLGFYWVHRLLHTRPDWYRRIHAMHHRAYAPVPIEYFYAHPVEWMSGAVPPVLALVALGLATGSINAWVLLGWVLFRQVHELDIHSGRHSRLGEWLPLWASPRHHDQHHAKPHRGNYASTLTLWDSVFRTRF